MAEPPSQPVPPEQTDSSAATHPPAEISSRERSGPPNHAPPTAPATQTPQTTQPPLTPPTNQSSETSQPSQRNQTSSQAPRAAGMSRGAGLASLVALFLGLGVFLRWLSFATAIEAIASIAAMILFTPAMYVVIWLGWTVNLNLRHVATCVLAFSICFAAWNAVMLPGLSAEDSFLALQVNSIHWGTFLLGGCISLRFLQWITGIGIAASHDNPLAPEPLPGKLSVSKLLVITAACGLCVEGIRRSELLTPLLSGFSEPSDSESYLSRGTLSETPLPRAGNLVLFSEDSLSSKLWSLGALGGLFLGIHWTVLAALRHTGAYRTAGIIVWIAMTSIVRWFSSQISAWEGSMAIPLINTTATDDVYYSMIVLNMPNETTPTRVFLIAIEAILQTGLAWVGMRWFAKWGYPIQFLRRDR